jgi:hypothetical protein
MPKGETEMPMPNDAHMDAFTRGIEAFRRGTPLDCNPYPEDNPLRDETTLREFWNMGWISEQHLPARKSTSRTGTWTPRD